MRMHGLLAAAVVSTAALGLAAPAPSTAQATTTATASKPIEKVSGKSHVLINPANAAGTNWNPEQESSLGGRPLTLHATEPTAGPKATDPKAAASPMAAAKASVWGTTGRLLTGGGVCTANVVSSANRDVIATARHCVEGGHDFQFAPNYDAGNAPYGWWTWRAAGWVTAPAPQGDIAFIVLNTKDGRHIADVVGATGIGFNRDIGNDAHIIGIPGVVPASKEHALWCGGRPVAGPEQPSTARIDNCIGLSGGASGGPFFVDYDQNDGSAVQTGAFVGGDGWQGTWWAVNSYYRDDAYNVFNGAQNA
ncbi:trypsin-like serine peptidase [Kitasatospora sp. NPDC057512]|uniref:trypsin-like serine peptidase n=1 Tax=Kitasatospora sp. NPDC057512 TaxID=3346154 RepID=UPI003688B4BC